MPPRSILSAAERASLFAMPDTQDELIWHYTFGESDLALICQRRGDTNRLGFAVQLAYMRYPGIVLGADDAPFPPLLRRISSQLNVSIDNWNDYGRRDHRSGERSGDWLKWRANRGQEFVIGGYIPNDNLVDSILVGYYEDGDLLYAGRARAALTATSRRVLLAHIEELRIPRGRLM